MNNHQPVKKPNRKAAIATGAVLTLFVTGVLAGILAVRGVAIGNLIKTNPSIKAIVVKESEPVPEPIAPVITHINIPTEVRGIYITASSASSWSRYQNLLSSAKVKGVNAVVIDLKADSGALAFKPLAVSLKDDVPQKILITDLDRLVKYTHEQEMYLIARIPVFEDPDYAERHPKIALQRADGSLWRNRRGIAWIDAAAEDAWKYNVEIAKEAYTRGFDEIQFDYIRFATDGSISQIVYPVFDSEREDFRGVIARLFTYLDTELRGAGIPISVDLFGFTTWHQNDLGIGQWYDDAVRHFDFVSPMVYPSHYPAGTLGFKNPADYPYEIVLDSLKKGNEVLEAARAADPNIKLATQRAWIQAFNMGAIYTPAMMLEQVRASRETDSSGFLFWNAGNNYSSLPDLTK